MARPRKQPHEQRNASIRVSLTGAEKLFVQEQADAAGLSETEYSRRRLLQMVVKIPPAQVNAKLLHDLNRIALNLQKMVQKNTVPSPAQGISGELTELVESLALNEH